MVTGDDQRGGIRVRDYTQGDRMSRSVLKKINIDQVARALIWASMGLGMMEIIMPRRIQKLVGVRRGNYSGLIRAAGIREMMHAFLIFIQARPLTGVWSRVAGDALDLGLLGAAFTTPRVKQNRLSIATASILGITALDVLTALQLNRKRAEAKGYSAITQAELDGRIPGRGFHVMRSITINSSPETLYRFWRNFENLPQFMIHLQEVRVLDERRSHWVTKGPAGTQVEWDAEITDDRPNELIAWQSTTNATVPNSGVVRFEPAPAGRGTVVRVDIEYRPPAGAIGRIVAKLFGEEPTQQIVGDLARFKQVIETGEVVRSDGSPQGLGQKLQRPARPLPDDKMNKMTDKYGKPSRSEYERQRERESMR